MKTAEFVGELKKETEKAYLISDGIEDHWLPQRLISDMVQVDQATNTYEFTIPEWLAIREGIV